MARVDRPAQAPVRQERKGRNRRAHYGLFPCMYVLNRTDTDLQVPEFISQRRRWLNGSLFASVHATVFWFRIWTSGQGFFRKIILQIEFIYNAIQLLFTWTSLANFYLAFFFVRPA